MKSLRFFKGGVKIGSRDHQKGIVSCLIGGASRREDKGYKFLLKGDLFQMEAQKIFLENKGFEVGQVNIYPALKTQEDYDKAITLIWQSKINGWWGYKERLIDLGVCTKEEFDTVLHKFATRKSANQK